MRRVVLRVREEHVDVAYDRLLPQIRSGLHACPEGDEIALVALGDAGELPAVEDVARFAGDVLVGEVVEEDAGDDLVTALTALAPSFEIGDRVVLRTPVHPAPAEHMIDIVLERGMGFGTGSHPTTRHCIELLLGVDPVGSFADLGCGAGALTITAAKLGFAPVVGIDFVDGAAETAWRNAEANGVDAEFLTGDLRRLDTLETEIAAANVSEFDVHLRLAEVELPELSVLIVSGLDHPGKLAHALAGYARMGFVEERRIDRLGWPAVLMRR